MSVLPSQGKGLVRKSQDAFTFIENIFAMAIVVLFFCALYAMSSQSLYMLNAGRGAVVADESLQDRIEQLRNCTWSQLTDASYLQSSVLNSSTNGGAHLGRVTETVTVNAYPIALSPPTSVVRSNGSANITTANASIANGDLVRVDSTLTWTAGPGGRARTQATTALIAKYTP
jgi:hypothetical protein